MTVHNKIIGVDLDGVCADFYTRMREIAAEWFECGLDELTAEVSYGLAEYRWPDGRRYVTPVGEIEGDGSALYDALQRTWTQGQKQITLRIDPDVLTFFRKHGRGYQSTINAVLRKYMEARKERTL